MVLDGKSRGSVSVIVHVVLTDRALMQLVASHQAKALIKSILHTDSHMVFCIFVSLTGMDPNWRHIIPPGQKRVISEGQCIEDCTGYAFPSQGINIFAVMMRTHQIGKEVKLRQVSRLVLVVLLLFA